MATATVLPCPAAPMASRAGTVVEPAAQTPGTLVRPSASALPPSTATSTGSGRSYMSEYPIARAFVDARVSTLYGGTSEVKKMIIGRDLTGPS